MAPTAPKKRPAIRVKASHAGSGLIPRPRREGAVLDDNFLNSKKDKRTIKHSSFINRIEKAHIKPVKRRRPNKKLVTNLESLGDVLGELESGLEKRSDLGKFTEKSLNSKGGALKRKEKLERTERERFGKNMVQLVSAPAVGTEGGPTKLGATASRWGALKGFISQTMQQEEIFKKT
ncbi:ribosome biogenesis protein SLX9-domain-containing protein [Calycina marina]|uniref:Ribosome biogenesis protein SLX9 n=1 Tax=Calycina marina TaxID=1763456 RepID=A0A9P7Z0J5_9HELO|nr:ribosome biogenesis protein SLX9-domain-containing protein [Calycina marina]